MNRYAFLALILALSVTPVKLQFDATRAQPAPQGAPDPAFLQKAVQALQTQRNNEADQRAVAEARAAMLQDEVTKLQKELADARKPNPPQAGKEEPVK